MARLRGNYRFPNDEEFKRGLLEHDLYGLRVCKHMLDRLENAGHQEPSPVQDFSIEHIMPQEITDVPQWQEMLGEAWAEEHGAWLHRLGNLTLTAYNSTYSNRPFQDKQVVEGGFRQSAVRLNQDVRDAAQWTRLEIRARGARLADRALTVWPHHEADAQSIQAAHIRDLRKRAEERSASDLEMNGTVREVLDGIRSRVRELADIIEVIEHKSIGCYAPDFFAELMPMRHSVRAILALEIGEVEIPDGLTVHDASTWKFVPNRVHTDSNLIMEFWDEATVAGLGLTHEEPARGGGLAGGRTVLSPAMSESQIPASVCPDG